MISREIRTKNEVGYPFDEEDIKMMDIKTFLMITGAGKFDKFLFLNDF